MHEMSLCSAMVELLIKQAEQQKFKKVTAVWVDVGPFSCVEPEALSFCFLEVAKGSLVESAQLHLNCPDGKAWCFDCEQDVVISMLGEHCPECNGYQLKRAEEDNLRITEIEVE
jgi:hydrogenase nickel incorporation protein HypA/HybF